MFHSWHLTPLFIRVFSMVKSKFLAEGARGFKSLSRLASISEHVTDAPEELDY
jgi:hypothetical protein